MEQTPLSNGVKIKSIASQRKNDLKFKIMKAF